MCWLVTTVTTDPIALGVQCCHENWIIRHPSLLHANPQLSKPHNTAPSVYGLQHPQMYNQAMWVK